MSLELTPTTGRHDRPPPPSRSKRSSAQARTGTSTPTHGLGLGIGLDDEELGRASKKDLEDALKERWVENDKLQERILELEERVKVLERVKEEMGRVLGAIQERCEEAFKEQTRLEMDAEARDDLLDRLRSRLAMLERELRESQRVAQVQERAFEAERTSLQAQEAHLNSRIRQLQTTTKLVAPSSSPSETLQEDLDSLRSSHSTLLGQLDRLSSEVQELRGENGRLKEENEGWEYLVREQTFSNRLFQREEKEDEGGRYTKSQLDVLDEEMDEEMNHLHSELEAQSPTDEIFPKSTPRSRQPSTRMGRNMSGPSMYSDGSGMSRNISGVSSMYTEEPVEGMDLAAELGRADLGPVVLDAVGEEMNAEKENKRLREEVKALQLYCSKIIDRIIAQDGFEHILNVDYKTKRVGRAGNRGSLLDVVKMMQGDVAPVPVVEPATEVKPRPVSMARGNSAGETKVDEDKSSKRARRGFSLDLRNFGFKSPTSTPEPKPLRPLQLVPSPAQIPARKLDPHPEDEDDRRERSRLEAALKLMGIDKSSHPSPFPAPTTGQSVKRSSSIKTSGTPLSRLSSALGFSDQLPPDPDPSPKSVDAALKEYDVKEQARRLSLSTGKEGGGYTSPPRFTRRVTDTGEVRRSGSGSISTLWSVNDTPSPDNLRR